MIIQINPVTVFPSQANQLLLFGFSVNPGVSLIAQYRLLCSGNPVTPVGYISLTPGQYTGWNGSTDDMTYLPFCLASNLGLVYTSGSPIIN
jgi:hypothetical protein